MKQSKGNWGHPLKGTCQEKKVFHKQEEAFFLGEQCGCENGPPFGSSEQPPPYRLFCSRSNLLPTLHGSLRFFLTERSSLLSHPLLSHCRSFFRFVDVRPLTAPVTHQDQGLLLNSFLSATPVRFCGPRKSSVPGRVQFVDYRSHGC